MEGSPRRHGSRVAAGFCSLLLLAAGPGSMTTRSPATATASRPRCAPTPVRYRPDPGAAAGLARLPWIVGSPASTGLVGHLFYYDDLNVWKQRRLPGLRLYSSGESPDGRISMKILWELRRGSALALGVRGRRVGGSGSFSQQLPPTRSNGRQYPSIISVPAAGCWRLTLTTGRAAATVTALVLTGRKR